MDHAVDIAIEPEKQSELCFVLDFAFDGGARRVFSTNTSHGLRMVCFRPREIRRFGVDLEDLYFDFLRG